jgi:hypothetical protein
MTKKATLKRCYYRSEGQMLTKNKFVVVFAVNGEEYSISLPNNAWSYMTPPLQFMAYIDTKPSDFKGTSFTPDNDIELPVVWNNDKEQWFLHTQVFQEGQQKLKKLHGSIQMEQYGMEEALKDLVECQLNQMAAIKEKLK